MSQSIKYSLEYKKTSTGKVLTKIAVFETRDEAEAALTERLYWVDDSYDRSLQITEVLS